MALKGTESKQKVIKVLTEVFKGSFINDKTLIIPFEENGEKIQLKVSLTACKELVEGGDGGVSKADEYTEEEKAAVEELIKLLMG